MLDDRPGNYQSIDYVVRVNTLPGRRMRWSFETSNGLKGEGDTRYGIEAAFSAGARAAHEAIGAAGK